MIHQRSRGRQVGQIEFFTMRARATQLQLVRSEITFNLNTTTGGRVNCLIIGLFLRYLQFFQEK